MFYIKKSDNRARGICSVIDRKFYVAHELNIFSYLTCTFYVSVTSNEADEQDRICNEKLIDN